MASPNGITELSRWARAPEALVTWCEPRADADTDIAELGTDRLTELVAALPDAAWAPWVAAVATIPMDLVAVAVVTGVEVEVGRVEGAETLAATLDLACRALVDDATGDECIEAAERCDRLADAPPPAGYRSSSRTWPLLARAAAHCARAAEAISAVRAHAELDRMNRARAVGALLGAGVHAAVTPEEPPVLFARPALGGPPDEALVFATESLGAALGHVAAASSHEAAVRAFVDALRSE